MTASAASVCASETTPASTPETTSLTVRGLDAAVKAGLQERAALNNRSMEAEVREILTRAIEPINVGREFHELAQQHGGFDELADIISANVAHRREVES